MYILEAAFGAEKATSKSYATPFMLSSLVNLKQLCWATRQLTPLGCFRQGRSLGDGGTGGNSIIRPWRWACYA
jgi:hypothetical protein